ncbi:NADPH-dependent F420 reductase [Ruania zhangjianzhongii]|uniref:NADPH-dependent F420 reductase n=1 Tax=Ruania zhangjianzhongii TaxID=2603206 RepID=UPI0011CA6159|nr:NAD(P)-binding domain-containing protein [Ruania zhangjianzhongii]
MRIGLLGTGNMAIALGTAWASAGHRIVVTGRDRHSATRAAGQIAAGAIATNAQSLAANVDVIVVAIRWEGLQPALSLLDGPSGALAGRTVIDCTNAVDFTTGDLLPATGSAAEVVAAAAPGAQVVKALHLFAGTTWPFTGDRDESPVVALCGDDAAALEQASTLVAALGAQPLVIGGLGAARQAEEAAGFITRVAAAGGNPRRAVPDVDPARLDEAS